MYAVLYKAFVCVLLLVEVFIQANVKCHYNLTPAIYLRNITWLLMKYVQILLI